MSSRSHGRPTPSRGARVERRKATRTPAPDEPRAMTIPDAIRALGPACGQFCHVHFSWLCQAGQGQCQRVPDRDHAGLNLPCGPCAGPCRIDDQPAGGEPS